MNKSFYIKVGLIIISTAAIIIAAFIIYNRDAVRNEENNTINQENNTEAVQTNSANQASSAQQKTVKKESILEKIAEVIPDLPSIPLSNNSQPEKFVLYNIGINLGYYDPSTKMAGDILFTNTIGEHYYRKAFLEFGAELTGPSGTDVMPHPTYFLPLGTKVLSPVDGTIENIRQQPESNDYEIVIVPEGFSKWRVGLDHVVGPTVNKGDKVKAGQAVAQVAPSRSSAVPQNLGWMEMQVWGETFGRSSSATCPFLILDESVKQDIYAKITKLAEDWESYLGQDVYKEEKWVAPGCLFENAEA